MQIGDIKLTLRITALPDPSKCDPTVDRIGVLADGLVLAFFWPTTSGRWAALGAGTLPHGTPWFWASEPTPLEWRETEETLRAGCVPRKVWTSGDFKIYEEVAGRTTMHYEYVLRELNDPGCLGVGYHGTYLDLGEAQTQAARLARDARTRSTP